MKRILLTLAFAIVLTPFTDLSAQTLSKRDAKRTDETELRPERRSYQTLLESARSEDVKRSLERYLKATAAEPSQPTATSTPLHSTNRTLDINEVSPVPGLGDNYFYVGHSTVQLPGGDNLVFYWQDALKVVMRFNDGSWTSPADVATDVFSDPIRAVRTGSGRVVVAAPSPNGIVVAYSDNVISAGIAAATWQTTALSGDNYGIDMKPTPDGGLLLTYNRYDPSAGVTRYWMRKSADGVAWTPEMQVVSENASFGIFDATVAAVSATELILVFVEAANDGLHLSKVTSSNGGSTWSSPVRVLTNPEGLEPLPTLAQTSDGTTWLVYTNLGDIWYMKSTDGGASWSTPEKWTRYAGTDWFPSLSVLQNVNTPLVTFSSRRTFPNERIWIASLVAGADANSDYLPPAVDFDFSNLSFYVPHNTPVDVRVLATDETGISSVNLFYMIGETTTGPIAATDDGNGGWIATLPGQPIGTYLTYFATATDTDGLTGSTPFPGESQVIGFHSVGAVAAGMPGGSIADIEWPAGSGDQYFCCGGLWIGANNNVIQDWMWVPDPAIAGSVGPGESNQDIVVGIREPDWLGPDETIGVNVVQRSHQWGPAGGKVQSQATGRENGFIVEYEVRSGDASLPEVFVGLFMDADIFVGFPDWEDDLIAYEPSMGLLYMYDSGDICASDPDVDCAPGYMGLAVLSNGGSGKLTGGVTPYSAGWAQGSSAFAIMTQGINSTLASGIPVDPSDYQMMLTAQPISLAPFESKRVAFAVVMGAGLGELVTNLQAIEAAYETFVVSVDEPVDSTVPTEFALGQNYPNPFNPSTTISYSLPSAQRVDLSIYNVLGELVETLVAGDRAAGTYQVAWDAANVASGMYFYRLNAGSEYSSTRSLVVLK